MLELLQHTPFLQVDQFLPGPVYADLRSYADRATYDTIENPADGVTYPGICAEIPEPVIDSVTKGLRLIRRGDVTVNYLFLRLSTEGVEAPQVVHSDETMGDYSLMLYMGGNPKGATAFVQHAEYEGDMRARRQTAIARCSAETGAASTTGARLTGASLHPIGRASSRLTESTRRCRWAGSGTVRPMAGWF